MVYAVSMGGGGVGGGTVQTDQTVRTLYANPHKESKELRSVEELSEKKVNRNKF